MPSPLCTSLTALRHGYALVQYDALFDDEAGTTHLHEWFPVPAPGPAADTEAGRAAADGFAFHSEPGYCLRPKPPAEVTGRGRAARVLGSAGSWSACCVGPLGGPCS